MGYEVKMVQVYRRPKIAVLSTGDELVDPLTGSKLGRGQVSFFAPSGLPVAGPLASFMELISFYFVRSVDLLSYLFNGCSGHLHAANRLNPVPSRGVKGYLSTDPICYADSRFKPCHAVSCRHTS